MRAAEILETEKQSFARTMTLEMGKPINAAVQEAEKCALVCRYYAENAERHLADEIVQTNATKSYVHFQPLGIVLAIMPWNFPFWQVFRFAAPALMAGNVGLLKHASNVPQCALAIEDIFRRAGFPPGAFQTLLIGTDAVQEVLEDPRVAAATLTGSEPAGRSVASIAGKNIKKAVLELGGSDPFIVMPSANFDEAVSTAVKARTINNGQSCIAAKRFIVHEQIYDRFESEFVAAMKSLRVGDPLDPSIDIGPLATEQILTDVEDQVKVSVAAGAKILDGWPASEIRRRTGARTFLRTDRARGHSERLAGVSRTRSLARLLPSFASAQLTKRSNSRTQLLSGLARRRGRTRERKATGSSMRSKPALSSSTAWLLPIRVCHSAA